MCLMLGCMGPDVVCLWWATCIVDCPWVVSQRQGGAGLQPRGVFPLSKVRDNLALAFHSNLRSKSSHACIQLEC